LADEYSNSDSAKLPVLMMAAVDVNSGWFVIILLRGIVAGKSKKVFLMSSMLVF
jgi:hypothetical protein